MRNGKLMTTKVAAIALSSMMVLSPLTAFASSGGPGVTYQPGSGREIKIPDGLTAEEAEALINKYAEDGDIFGEYEANPDGSLKLDANGNPIPVDPSGSIQSGKVVKVPSATDPTVEETISTYFLDDGDSAQVDKKNVDNEDYKDTVSAYFKKTISLRDYKNKTDFIPSVPDVVYTYEIAPVTGVYTTAQGYKEATIFDGKEGGVYFGEKSNKVYTDKLTFNHGDNPETDEAVAPGKGKLDGDKYTMTRLMNFNLDSGVFKGADPGIYRYIIVETNEENIEGVSEETPKDILDDVTKIADEYRGRIIDVVVERVSSHFDDETRRIAGVALREVQLSWSYKGNGERDHWQILDINDKIKVEGYTPYSFEDKGKYGNSPKEAYSRYYTFDLLVDKEVTGQGLTDKDVAATYSITVDLEGPAGAKVEVVVSNAESGAPLNDNWTLGTDGKLTKTVGLKNNQSFEISGLPSGATYTIKEAKDSVLSKVLTNTELNKTVDGTITMDAADEKVAKVEHDKAIASSTKDVTNSVDGDKNVIVANAEKVQKLTWTEEEITGLNDIDVQNVLITNERLPITVTGVVMNVAPYALMVIAAAIFAGLFISKKRQEEEI